LGRRLLAEQGPRRADLVPDVGSLPGDVRQLERHVAVEVAADFRQGPAAARQLEAARDRTTDVVLLEDRLRERREAHPLDLLVYGDGWRVARRVYAHVALVGAFEQLGADRVQPELAAPVVDPELDVLERHARERRAPERGLAARFE